MPAARIPGRRARPTGVRRLLLTASGGPFLNWSAEALAQRDAGAGLRPSALEHGPQDLGGFGHPDEQGLELIEASVLFGMPVEQIEVLVHPQSIVHSLVEYVDGSVLAQLAAPDMRVPIAQALAMPAAHAGRCRISGSGAGRAAGLPGARS